jgi:gluconokinase
LLAAAVTTSPERAERPLVLALDIGSSSVRAAVHDRLGRAVSGSSIQVPYAWEVAADGAVRLSPLTLLELVGRVLDELVVAAEAVLSDISAAGTSCFFHSITGLDKTGGTITPLLSWADTTSAPAAFRLRQDVDVTAMHLLTGAPIHASYWPARILRLRLEAPTVHRWVGFPELLAELLTGRHVISRCMASGTGLLDRASGGWAEPLMEQIGVDGDELPAIVNDDEPIGRLSGAAARRWPQLARLDWFAAWGDGACGNVGLRATCDGKAALMVGTSGAVRAIVGEPAPAVPDGLFAYRLGGEALLGGQLSEGGGLLAWAGRLLGRSLASLERGAAMIEPAAHGLTVLPYTFGERGLGYHDRARGTLTGLTPGTDASSVYRAIVESIAYGFAALDERLSSVLGRPPSLIVSGGALTHSPLLGQVLADSLGRDIGIATGVEASREGAALLALRGSGVLLDLEAVPALRLRVVHADPDRTARHGAARARQRELYEALVA